MATMDAFSNDAFGMLQLTAAVNRESYVPGRIGRLGIFEERGVRTTKVAIEYRDRTVELIPTTPRGGVPHQNQRDGRDVVDFQVPRLALLDRIYADEVLNVRAFGRESDLMALMEEVRERQRRMTRSLDATLEWHRMGALKGQILDADGSVLIDLFTALGVSQRAEVAMDFSGTATGDVKPKISGIIRATEDELGVQDAEFHAYCGSTFFDELTGHEETRQIFLNYDAARTLRERTARRTFFYGGVLWEEYRGNVSGQQFVADDKAIIFPVGVPGLYITRFAPADYWGAVGTQGLPRYSRQYGDPTGADRYRELEVQSNPINLCTRPRALGFARSGA